MKYFKTPHEKKSAVITALITTLLIFLFFLLGLKYYDPPITFGMEVNLGNAEKGTGKSQQKKLIIPETSPKVTQKKSSTKAAPKQVTQSKVIKQESSDIAVPEKTKKKPSSTSKQFNKKVVPTRPKVDQATKKILSKLVNQKKILGKKDQQAQGNDKILGDKGKIDGNPYSNTYFNLAGLGGMGKGFGLNGRRLESRGKVTQICNQEGVVVVRITVNRQGDVVKAEPGVKGTTNTHPCLLQPAKETALLHRWFPDLKAPAEQIGFVVIQFKLRE